MWFGGSSFNLKRYECILRRSTNLERTPINQQDKAKAVINQCNHQRRGLRSIFDHDSISQTGRNVSRRQPPQSIIFLKEQFFLRKTFSKRIFLEQTGKDKQRKQGLKRKRRRIWGMKFGVETNDFCRFLRDIFSFRL